MSNDTDNKDNIALMAAAFAVQSGHKTIDGMAVMAIISFVSTHKGMTSSEVAAHSGKAFDIFASAVRMAGN